jgi:chromosome segregation ATPase
MTSLEQIKEKVDDLSRRYKAASSKKSTLNGLLQAKREELVALKKEIEDAGYDPKRLKEDRDKIQAEVLAMIEDFEKKLGEVEVSLAAFDKK